MAEKQYPAPNGVYDSEWTPEAAYPLPADFGVVGDNSGVFLVNPDNSGGGGPVTGSASFVVIMM